MCSWFDFGDFDFGDYRRAILIAENLREVSAIALTMACTEDYKSVELAFRHGCIVLTDPTP